MTKTVDDYLAALPRPTQVVLGRVRSTIRKALPGAEEAISYGIPVYKLHGRNVVYFAGWKEHYAVYPLNKRMEAAFATELARYEISGKGTVRFPLTARVPVGLIQRIARFRAKEVVAAAAVRRQAAKKR